MFCMNCETFEELLTTIRPVIKKKTVDGGNIVMYGGILTQNVLPASYEFYLNVFFNYLPIKHVGYYKFSNEVIVWFMQMICYNVYIPLQMMWRKIQVIQYLISLVQHTSSSLSETLIISKCTKILKNMKLFLTVFSLQKETEILL